MKTYTETWVSDRGNEEIHHFEAGTQTYLWGFNKRKLGPKLYDIIKILIEQDINLNGGKQ